MPNKLLDRLMFAQVNHCFFCKQPLAREEASVEHLVATANGGSNTDDNCVACCVTVNAMFGRMSLKDKLEVILKHKGSFQCPNGNQTAVMAATTPPPVKASKGTTKKAKAAKAPAKKAKAPPAFKEDDLRVVVANLQQRGESRPRTMKTLTSTIASLFPAGITHAEVAGIVRQLQKTSHIKVDATKVSYPLLEAPTVDPKSPVE